MTSRSRRLVLPIGLYLAAFGLRLVFILESLGVASQRTPLPGLDAHLYWQAALDLRHGVAPSFDLMICSAPGFVWELALLQWLLGEDALACRIALAALAALRAPLIYALARRLTGRTRPALIIALVTSMLPSLVYFDSVLLKSSLELTWLTLLLWLLVGLERPRSQRAGLLRGVLIGALLALCFLSQLNTFLYLLPVLGFLAVARGWHARVRLAVAAPAALIFALAFVSFVSGGANRERYLPRGGVELHAGNRGGVTSTGYQRLPDVPAYPYGHTFVARLNAERELGRPLLAAEADRHYLGKAWAWVSSNPSATAGLASAKAVAFFADHEPASEEYLPYLRSHSRLLAALPLGFGVLVLLAAPGLVLLARERRFDHAILLGGLVLVLLAVNVMTFVTWRTRLPATIPLALLAAVGLAGLEAWLERRRTQTRALARPRPAPLVAAALAGLIAYLPDPDPDRHSRAMAVSAANEELSESAEVGERRLRVLEAHAARTVEEEDERLRLLVRLHLHDEAYRALVCAEVAATGLYARRQLDTYRSWLGGLPGGAQAAEQLAAAACSPRTGDQPALAIGRGLATSP